MASVLRSLPRRISTRSHNCSFITSAFGTSCSKIYNTNTTNPRSHISPLTLTTTSTTQRRTMATDTTPKKYEWLVVVPDFPGVHQKRMDVRPQHFAGLQPSIDSGLFQMGGAVLNEVPEGTDPSKYSFAGSTIVVQAASREEVKEILRRDIYAQSGVWDVENTQMWPLLCAFRYPVKGQKEPAQGQ
ncbi:hypothetical protein N656DRAFT_797349 [Canariomyces notabilis]|uniref:YCII-related domain-containing protein n=1 Tax=Canariomyces notabilis TaxID=2074819 RepID=A0AAN6YTB0_9PEZI|nr:hypothetical protein N656DRAFT_797349 [Canariomyces arenarius]